MLTALKDNLEAAKRNISVRLNLTKYRCMNSDFFEATNIRKSYLQMLTEVKGLSFAQAELFLQSHRGYLLTESVKQSIERNIAWCFDRDNFIAQRYNTELFGAYYTGKEVETCEKEFAHHYLKNKTIKPTQYTIFSIQLSGKLSDLRPISEIRAQITDDSDYSVCQFFAAEMRSLCDGLAVPSVRNSEVVPVYGTEWRLG